MGDTLIPVLKEDSRLEIITGDIKWNKYSDIIQPDFNSSELSDIDLVATGKFLRGEDKLTVIANLYDVKSETIKAGITWEGSIGLNIFDAIDEISQDFRDEVDKVIPEAGKVLIMRNDIIYSGLSSFDARIERKLQIKNRFSRKHLFSVITGLSGNFIRIETNNPDAPNDLTTGTGGPYFPILLNYEYNLQSNFAVGIGLELIDGKLTSMPENNSINPFMISINPSMKLVIRGLKSDLILGLGPSFKFLGKETVSWEDGQIWEDTIGPIFIAGLQLDAGFRIYLNKRANEMPSFIYLGVSEGFLQYFIEPWGNNIGSGSFNIEINIGWGIAN